MKWLKNSWAIILNAIPRRLLRQG